MGPFINTNLASLFAQRELRYDTQQLNASQQKLSTGTRIVRSADDPTGLSFSEAFQDQVQYSKQAERNVQDGLSLLNIADSGLGRIANNLQRMREITVQAGSATLGQPQLNAIAQEIASLASENDRIATSTKFNGISLLNGSTTTAKIQVGGKSNVTTNTVDISAALSDAQNTALGVLGGTAGFVAITDIWNPATQTTQMTSGNVARAFLDDLDTAIANVNAHRVSAGAAQAHLESANEALEASIVKVSAANSAVRDTNVATETSLLTQSQVKQQAVTSILSQANGIRKEVVTALLQQ